MNIIKLLIAIVVGTLAAIGSFIRTVASDVSEAERQYSSLNDIYNRYDRTNNRKRQ